MLYLHSRHTKQVHRAKCLEVCCSCSLVLTLVGLVQADALGEENKQLRSYIERLEKEQSALATKLVGWQTRWKTTASNNVKLYHQLVNLQQCKMSAVDPVS